MESTYAHCSARWSDSANLDVFFVALIFKDISVGFKLPKRSLAAFL